MTFSAYNILLPRYSEYRGNKMLYADKIARIYGWPIRKWDVSEIDGFDGAFEDQVNFNEGIGEWDVSNATNPSFMFYNATSKIYRGGIPQR
eukprot:CAMPEP_0194201528 /NCGR_PEP_ID=MMETSP0156-20130528/1769_1 /TAXON_ID=33649 /ORGANISM="Thalassionema nitzschioides, Strain L26-B" /LENGTH=90 /DNA_ID=CAMNT_0038926735 /DNA_START=133 /DNA_END=405 /DNA_ORIENTATION=+